MRVLVTGGKGFIAGRLQDFLKKKRVNVLASSRKKNYKNFQNINWKSKANLKRLCKKVDFVINCSGLDIHGSKSKSEALRVNSKYPLNLYEAANSSGVKLFIFISTYHVYKKKKIISINEKTKIKKSNFYSESKIDGEKRLLNFKNKSTKLLIIRPCNLFGYPYFRNKNCWKLLINSIVKDFIEKNKFVIKSRENSFRNYSSMKSFCEFIFNILSSHKNKSMYPKIINYCSEKNLSIMEITKIVAKKIGIKKNKIIYDKKNFKNVKKTYYKSLFQKKFKSKKDIHFNDELKKLISYSNFFFNN